MDIEVISTGPIEELIDNKLNSLYQYNCKLMDNNYSLFDRRDVLKLAGIGILALATPSIFLKKEAEAVLPFGNSFSYQQALRAELERRRLIQALLPARLGKLALQRYDWQVRQPTAGQVTLVNNSPEYREGQMVLAVVGEGNVEDLQRGTYSVPGGKYQVVNFTNGPYGVTPGYKQFASATSEDQKFTNMVVNV
jgi:hypothetical protein